MKIKIVLVVTMLLSGLQIRAMTDDDAGVEPSADSTALNQSDESGAALPTDSESTPEPDVALTEEKSIATTNDQAKAAPTESGPIPSPEPMPTETEAAPVVTQPTSATLPTATPAVTQAVPTSAQSAPTKLQPVSGTQEATPVEESEEGIIDTMEIDDNVNWLEVRKYLQDATTLLEKIGVAYGQVSDMRMQYFQKRNQADKQFDDFMHEAGIDVGELIQKTNDYIQRVQAERVADGDLSQKERDFLDSLTKNKDTLDQLQQDLISLGALDASIDDILTTAEKQISDSRNYQTQAWQSFQKLETTPQNAESLYAKIEAAYQNVNQLYAYLQGALLQHFDDTITTLNTQITSIKNQINTLKSAGISLISGMKDFEAEEALEDQQAAAARCTQQSEEAVEAALEKARQEREAIESQSWLGKIKSFGSWIVDSVSSVFSWAKGLVGLGASKTTASESDVQVVETEMTTTVTPVSGSTAPQVTTQSTGT